MFELLIVISVVVILGTGGTGFYQSFAQDVELKSTVRIMGADLRYVQSKSMGRIDDVKWGVHFVNAGSARHYYELFSTPTNYADGSMLVAATTTLPSGLTFSDPSSNTSKDIIFNKVSGTTTALSTISVTSQGRTQTVTVSALGTIY